MWQGTVQQPAFKAFSTQVCSKGAAEARALLQRHGVEHYWDAAEGFAPELAAAPEL